MSDFEVLRKDVAAIAAEIMGIPVSSTWSGNPESEVGQVRWGGNGVPWLSRGEGITFCRFETTLSILVTASPNDLEGAQEFLEQKMQALLIGLDASHELPTVGGYCPPVDTVTEPAKLSDSKILGSLATLFPIEHHLGT